LTGAFKPQKFVIIEDEFSSQLSRFKPELFVLK